MLVSSVHGCSGDTETAPGPTVTETAAVLPADIPDGAECTECGMHVEKDGLFSSEAVTAGGKYHYFCDIGDLLIYLGRSKDNEKRGAFVRDYTAGGWVSAYDAFYLTEIPDRTPMRFGIAAFERRPDAEAYRDEKGGGTIYTYAGILADKPYE